MEKQLVIFELASESYGIEIANVESIIKMQEITRVPKCPDFVEGITNLRGTVLPVIDLAKRFSIPEQKRNNDTRIIVVSLDETKIGMIVTAVSEVLTIDDSVIEPAPAIVTTINSSFIAGIARIDAKLIILLNLDQILSKEEKAQTAKLAG
jgi:purine-binding chemotaxis protein CheW